MVFPPPPTDSIDWNNIGFRVREVNGHIQSTYSIHTKQWTAPTFIRSPILPIHGMAPGLNYGQQCYEGLKAFRSASSNSIHLFRPLSNAVRLEHSASFVSMPAPSTELFLKAVEMAVSLNAEFVPPAESGASMYIRPLLFGSSAQLGLSPPEEYTFAVFVLPVGVYHGIKPVDCVILESFDRAAPKGTGSAKVGGNYAPVLRHSDAAREEGFGITLHMDSQTRTYIDEFSTSGFIGVLPDKTLVIPESDSIIKSVTSDSVQRIAKDLFGWDVQTRKVKEAELEDLVEVIAAGTAAALVPVKSITKKSAAWTKVYGGEEPGEAFVALLDGLKGIQSGRDGDPFGWRVPVREFKLDEATGQEVEGIDQMP
ncbi:branched-chain amino acid aminotransferase II [Tuber magnatum]|uniref:Branched-chain amino acid aminotransferase II n=1 Tax=Tuber magnatum TaxID=42249 RepID=A0A317SL74_9PEZI|nr:branched-chain amino acid aminotransferase II [Tuber magnatum]